MTVGFQALKLLKELAFTKDNWPKYSSVDRGIAVLMKKESFAFVTLDARPSLNQVKFY